MEVTGPGVWDITGLDPAALRGADGRLASARSSSCSARRRDGSSFPIDMSLVALPLSERNMTCAIVEDRTEAKRLEMELRQAQKLEAVGQLSAGLAHEINTPCQYIGDNAAFVETTLDDISPLLASYRELIAVSAESAPPDPATVVGPARAGAGRRPGLLPGAPAQVDRGHHPGGASASPASWRP